LSHNFQWFVRIMVLVFIFLESLDRVISLYLANFTISILFNELLNRNEARPTSRIKIIILLNLKVYMSFTKSVNAFRLAYEHNFKLLCLLIIIYEVWQSNIYGIFVFWDVYFELLLGMIQKFNKLHYLRTLGLNLYLVFFFNSISLDHFGKQSSILQLEFIKQLIKLHYF